MKTSITKLVAVCGFLIGLSTFTANAGDIRYGGGLYAGGMTFDRDEAAAEGIEDYGFIIGLRGEVEFFNFLNIAIGGGIPIIEDEAEFKRRVKQDGGINDGDVKTEDSDITGSFVFGEAGIFFPLGLDGLRAGVNGGYQHIDLEREIPECDNCREENITIDDGFYVQPFIGYSLDNLKFEVSYDHYLDGDGIEGLWQLSVVYLFGGGPADAAE